MWNNHLRGAFMLGPEIWTFDITKKKKDKI